MSWQAFAVPAGTPQLNAIACSDALHCVAAGVGKDTWTTNGGGTWTLSSLPAANLTVLAATCVSATTCVAVGQGPYPNGPLPGVILRTTNGGSTWAQDPLPGGTFGLGAVICPSSTVCIAVGQGILVSSDGGMTWVTKGVSGGISGSLTSVACSNATICVALGPNPDGVENPSASATAIITTDGGGTWGQESFPVCTATLQQITCAPGTSKCFAGGPNPTTSDPALFYSSNDGGVSWNPAAATPLGINSVAAMSCPSAVDCVAFGRYGNGFSGTAAVSSTSNGATWFGVTFPFTVAITDSLPSDALNSPYVGTLTATGGTTPYAWTITGGTLPTGLSFNGSSGAISGTPTVGGTQTVTFTVTDSTDQSAMATLPVAIEAPGSPGPYSPLEPVRICDTRAGNPSQINSSPANQCNGASNGGSTIAAGDTRTINVANEAASFGVPADAAAVVLNVTAVNPGAQGYLSVYPSGEPKPVSSNSNFVAGAPVPNLVEVGIGTGGDVSIFSSATTDVVVDVEGYTSPNASGDVGAGLYNPLSSPARICDTRAASVNSPTNQCTGETLGTAGTLNVTVTGSNGIPAGATAAVLNVTAVNAAAQGFFTVYPETGTRPTASNVNYVAGKVSANRVIVPLSASGKITIYSAQSADVVVDVSGYYTASSGTGAQFTAEGAPARICDTRAASPANQCTGLTITAGGTLTVDVAGMAGVPATGATAVVVNLTGVDPSAQTFLTVFPALSRPPSSDLNPAPGTVRANLVVATLSATGKIVIYNNSGSIDVVVDVLGWYSVAT